MIAAASDDRRWTGLAYGYAMLVAGLLGYFLMRIPIQVSDCFSDLASLRQSMTELVSAALWQHSFLRPGRYVQLKIVYELAHGQYHYAFRFVHVAHVLVLVALFVRLVRPRSAAGLVSLPLALAVLVGGHTFADTLREAFPINHYLTIVVACAAAANLSFAPRQWWTDVLAVALLAVSALTLESGVLVWVVLVAGAMAGLRGVSRPGLAAATAVLALYFVVRLFVLDVGMPTLADREAGFGFRRYGGGELHEMFGTGVLPFYAYNLGASLLGMLAREPRDGIFQLTASVRRGGLDLPMAIGAATTLLASVLVLHAVWTRRHVWLARRFERDDQILALFCAMLVANAALGYAYTKDVILAPAGFFYAGAVFVACRRLVEAASVRRVAPWAAASVLFVLSSGWAVRAVGIHASLADTALDVRNQWVYVDDWVASRRVPMPPPVEALKQQLYDDALLRHPARPVLLERWTGLFEMK
ncbi:MAG TPA: hypothetical protein VGQ37_17245 [Vicinamibacterales bacterium]|nr:hypothetical protein [Vicinamibacterales bacterium]